MNTFELNKMFGALLGSVLLVMGLGVIADVLFAPHKPAVPGYKVEMASDESGGQEAEAEAEPEITLASLLSGGDAEKGAKAAKKCIACHTFNDGGANKVGPNLHGIVGKAMGQAEGFGYSDAIKALAADGSVWSYENLFDFMTNPKGYITGTNMAFAGIKKDGQRADLLLYLKKQSPNAPDLPQEAAVEAPEAEAPEAQPATDAPMTPAAETPAEMAPEVEPSSTETEAVPAPAN